MIESAYIKAFSSGGGSLLSTAKPMKTGQVTSYKTGDDGDLQIGRSVDFYTINEDNPFGNQNRFTDFVGGQTYANGIVIDWSTYNGTNVLCFYKTVLDTDDWDDAFEKSLAFEAAGFDGWHTPNKNELEGLCDYGLSNVMNYPPFYLAYPNNAVWTSTTVAYSTSYAFMLNDGYGISPSPKDAGSKKLMPCRYFSLSEIGI